MLTINDYLICKFLLCLSKTYSYKRDAKLAILCNVSKARVKYTCTLFNIIIS